MVESLRHDLRMRMARALKMRDTKERYESVESPGRIKSKTPDPWVPAIRIFETLCAKIKEPGRLKVYDPETQNRAETVRAIWNQNPGTGTQKYSPEALATAKAHLGPFRSSAGLFGLLVHPSPDTFCKAAALVATVMEYKDALCLLFVAFGPNGPNGPRFGPTPTSVDEDKSIDQMLQNVNVDEFVKILHNFLILNHSKIVPKKTAILDETSPSVRCITGALLDVGRTAPLAQKSTADWPWSAKVGIGISIAIAVIAVGCLLFMMFMKNRKKSNAYVVP